MIGYDGWYFPDDDTTFRLIALDDLDNLQTVLQLVEGRACVVQAGGNVGIFPMKLAEAGFVQVFTFEPDAENFECLQANCTHPAIIAHQMALSDEPGWCRVTGPRCDCGCLKTEPGDEVQVVTIDSLGLSACDLIYLDIEGAEHRALLGATATIDRCRPVIVVENKGLCEGYRNRDTFREFVESFGYTFWARLRGDDVFIPA